MISYIDIFFNKKNDSIITVDSYHPVDFIKGFFNAFAGNRKCGFQFLGVKRDFIFFDHPEEILDRLFFFIRCMRGQRVPEVSDACLTRI